MMKMKQRIITSLFLACAVAAATAPALLAQTKGVPDPLYARKSASMVDNDHVKLTLESFLSGNNVASDIAILMDLSDSMDGVVANSGAVYCQERNVTGSTDNWTYNVLNYGNTTGNANYQWFYKYTDGEYYPVRRANNLGGGSVRAMWIVTPDGTKYLNGSGLADDYDHSITSNTKTIFTGTLYRGWTQANVGANYYYKYNGTYYAVSSVGNIKVNGSNTQQLSVKIDGVTYYLNGNTITTEPNPYAPNDNNASLYFGDLYYKRTNHRKADFLKIAAEALVDALSADAKADGLHHRVALIQFNSSGWSNGNTATSYLPYPHLEESPIGGANAHLISDFKDVTVDENVSELKNAVVMPHNIAGVSHYEWGMSLAKGLFTRELGSASGTDINKDGSIQDFERPTLTGKEHDDYGNRPKIVVIIGDCQHNGDHSADDTYAKALKNDLEAYIFVVYVNTSTGAPLTNAKAWASREDLISKVKEFDETLVSTLEGLAREIREPLVVLDSGTVMQDGIADGFEIPNTTSDIKVYTADYATGHSKEEMTFKAPVLDEEKKYTPVVSTDSGGRQVVRVSGFDYYDNFCGTVGGEPHGQKLIVEITVQRSSAVGGPATVTNTSDSGVKYSDKGDFVTRFANPTLAFPVTVIIEKEGLARGESAVFTVQPVDINGTPVSSVLNGTVAVKPVRVILTGNASGTMVSKTLKHLNGNCYWKVTEEGWSWDSVPNGGNPSLSSVTQFLNPFVFSNVKQGTTIKSAESKVTNDFSSGTATTVNSREQ
jgi:hypothetical protein